MADVRIVMDENGIRSKLNDPETIEVVRRASAEICERAQAMSSGFYTKRYKRPDGTMVGHTSPVFASDARAGRKGAVGLVWTANYSAAKHNRKYNTLLKARG